MIEAKRDRKTKMAMISSSWCNNLQSISQLQLSKQQFYSHSRKRSNHLKHQLLHHTPLISLHNRNPSSSTCYCCSDSNNISDDPENRVCEKNEWDWNRWNRHFSDVEQTECFSALLKFQLEDAIEKEDFLEAAKLKRVIAETMSKDCLTEIMAHLKNAIDEERYQDASHLSRWSGIGLVGWWAVWPNDSSDPFGRLVRITPEVGRFVGRSYTPRQLVTSSPGTRLFEIFLVKDADGRYLMQVVYLQHHKDNSTNSPLKSKNIISSDSTLRAGKATVVNPQENEGEGEVEKSDKGIDIDEAIDEGMNSVINFLKEKLPGMKFKVVNVDVSEDEIKDSDPITRFMQEADEITESDDSSDEKASILEKNESEVIAASNNTEEKSNLDTKNSVGEVLQNKDNAPANDSYMRVPAEIREVEKDSFVLRVPRSRQDEESEGSKLSKAKVSAIAAHGVSELMPADIVKAFLKFDRIYAKVSKDAREIVKIAISQEQKRHKLSECTKFCRIPTSNTDLDPFEGLYVGTYGPYGAEVVQLRRKYGHWNHVEEDGNPSEVEFFEYVEAVKLTGDLNVPAGKVTFCAKIGKGSRIPNRGFYPDELGVITSYKGQGRVAEFGYSNPRWVNGQLLQLNGKGTGPLRGADLGFLFVNPAEQSFLVLFRRLTLPAD